MPMAAMPCGSGSTPPAPRHRQNWQQIYFTTSGDGGIDHITGLMGLGRYVRMYGIQRATQWGFSLWEFEVYGAPNLTGVEENPQLMPVSFNLDALFGNLGRPMPVLTDGSDVMRPLCASRR